jgi:hypothetical protein
MAVRYNHWFRKTVSQNSRFAKQPFRKNSMGNTYTGMGYLTCRRVTFNNEIKAELTDRNPRTN